MARTVHSAVPTRVVFTVIGIVLGAAVLLAAQTAARPTGPATGQPSASELYDIVIRNARIVDGTSAPWSVGDVAVRGDRIVGAGPTIAGRGDVEIDAAQQVLSPGFIDIHTHAARGIFKVPTAPNYVRQGVTTVVEGPDGRSPVPLKPFLDKVAATPISVNVASFLGQGSVRARVMGNVDRPATAEELSRMAALVEAGMRDGAFGLSSGLLYVPGSFTPPSEVIALARVAGGLGGLYISHMRDEASKVTDSTRETIDVGEQGGLPSQITHHKIVGLPNHGQSVETLRLVAEARARGVDVTIDQYPYTASSTGISVLFPRWALEGTEDEVLARLDDDAAREKITAAIIENIERDRGGGDPKHVLIASCAWDPSLAGTTLRDVTRERHGVVTMAAAAETVMWMVEQGGAQGIFHAMSEDDLQRILAAPWTMVASDGEIPIFGQASPHPRSYGTFARVLGRYVREERVLGLEEAVHKMTAMPAARLGLGDRGLIRPGMKADLALWDAERVRDRSTFERPHQYAEGVALVLVNGEIVFDGTEMTDARPGRVLYGPASRDATDQQ